ncbi:hypothetical protein RHMOL_Rhmol06G0101600 [Rhododendron molle]|uniref:Uncharacterized protein n=1 Tax=Rhododendron molle TaxID=49168 RepID=A0ACC0NBB7_RHOML|nr:hypothetical protein RHMOL_Rhmol06G0101600 [Rhododendron molle]
MVICLIISKIEIHLLRALHPNLQISLSLSQRSPSPSPAELPRLLFFPFIWSIPKALITAKLSTAASSSGPTRPPRLPSLFVSAVEATTVGDNDLGAAGGGAPSVSKQGKKWWQPSVGFVSGGLTYAATVSAAAVR